MTRRLASAFVLGLLFAVGLALGGMTLPSKVIGFFDFADGLTSWDPSLAFVMGGAMLVYMPAWRFGRRREHPILEERFRLPTRRDIDARLVLGAAIFGVGWGLGGFCPGPALTSMGSASLQALVMVGGMLVGAVAFRLMQSLRYRGES